jgi:hypothetical protein
MDKDGALDTSVEADEVSAISSAWADEVFALSSVSSFDTCVVEERDRFFWEENNNFGKCDDWNRPLVDIIYSNTMI